MTKILIALTLILAFSSTLAQKPVDITKTGRGNAVLFLPGFTTPGSVWLETVNNLKGKHESHLVSYAGFNGLQPIGTPWYDAIKKALLDYIDAGNLQELTIVGHSMGGTLAIDIAAERPSRISRLILVDALPCMRELMMPGVPADKIVYDSPYNNQTLALSNEAFKQTATMMAQYMTNRADRIDSLVQWSVKADRKTYVYGYTDLLRIDLRDALAKVKAKTLIIGASFPDKNTVTANFEKQYAKLENRTLAIADNSKHFVMFDQPEWFFQQVNAFLNP